MSQSCDNVQSNLSCSRAAWTILEACKPFVGVQYGSTSERVVPVITCVRVCVFCRDWNPPSDQGPPGTDPGGDIEVGI